MKLSDVFRWRLFNEGVETEEASGFSSANISMKRLTLRVSLGRRWRMNSPRSEAVNPQAFLLVSLQPVHVKDDTTVASSPARADY